MIDLSSFSQGEILKLDTSSGIMSVTVLQRGYGCVGCQGRPLVGGAVPCGFLKAEGSGSEFRAQIMVVPCEVGLTCSSLNTPGTETAPGGSVLSITV
jgi:hypothetical protein